MQPNLQPLFVKLAPGPVRPGPLGRRFAVHHTPPAGTPRALLVYVHAFAEEMNKSRRMAALQSRALAAAGFAVLQIDLLGCGDSDGDFGDATWAQWVDDVELACAWLRRQHPARLANGQALPLWRWGLRVGCLLALEAAQRSPGNDGLLLWQPTASGKTALQQFLRLKTAGEMLSGQARGGTAQLRQTLADGQAVDVAGYRIHPGMASGMEAATLAPPHRHGPVVWLEQAVGDDLTLSPAGSLAVQRWQQAGSAVQAQAVVGPAFWQTTEIEDAPAWITATLAALDAVWPQPAPVVDAANARLPATQEAST